MTSCEDDDDDEAEDPASNETELPVDAVAASKLMRESS